MPGTSGEVFLVVGQGADPVFTAGLLGAVRSYVGEEGDVSVVPADRLQHASPVLTYNDVRLFIETTEPKPPHAYINRQRLRYTWQRIIELLADHTHCPLCGDGVRECASSKHSARWLVSRDALLALTESQISNGAVDVSGRIHRLVKHLRSQVLTS